jgi:hypothetical protein
MASFVSKSGNWAVSVSSTPSRADTPILEMQNLVAGNVVQITCNFSARTDTADAGSGYYFQIGAVNTAEVTRLTPGAGLIQSSAGWQSCTVVGLFLLTQVSNSPTEDVDFEITFTKGDLNGQGRLYNFTMIGEVISTDTSGV